MSDWQVEKPPHPKAPPGWFARRTFEIAAIALGTAVALFFAWGASGGLFLVFAGLLFSVFLDACTRGLGRIWSGSRAWRLTAVSEALALLASLPLRRPVDLRILTPA